MEALLVDDDQEFCALLGDYLKTQGIAVTTAYDGPTGFERACQTSADIVVLDVMLPGFDGIEVLRRLRERSDLPVLMLTARGEDVDRIIGLELGADDYLAKPCNPREVVARIRAILRRASRSPGPALAQVAGLHIDPGSRTVTLDGQSLTLTSTEFSILEVLAQQAGQPVSKEALSEQALGRPLGRYDRAVDMHLSNLRRKLGPLADGRDRIETIRGVGYQLLIPPA